jgi:hypothetical protein
VVPVYVRDQSFQREATKIMKTMKMTKEVNKLWQKA